MNSSVSKLLSELPILKTKTEIVSTIEKNLQSKSGGYYAALNPEKIYKSIHNSQIQKVLQNANFLFMDGIGAKWAYSRLLNQHSDLVGGVDLMIDILNHNQNNSLFIGLFGSQEETVQKTKEILSQKYPQHRIAFAINGYEDGRSRVAQLLQSTQPDIVFVAMGSPAQEQWMFENSSRFPTTLFTGVGGAFDVISGNVRRAPQWIRNLHLEWLFRFLLQPIKRWKRMITLVRFLLLVLKK